MDVQISEYQATNPQIREGDYDTQLPLNINDDDWSSDMVEPPRKRTGFTVMTPTLVGCEILMAQCKLIQIASSNTVVGGGISYFDSHKHALNMLKQALDERDLQFCDIRVPMHWVVMTIALVAIRRLWFVHHLSIGQAVLR